LCGSFWPDAVARDRHYRLRCWYRYWAETGRYPHAPYRLKHVRPDEVKPRIARYPGTILAVALRRAVKENGGRYGSRVLWDCTHVPQESAHVGRQLPPWYVVQDGLDWWYALFAQLAY
jgi:hypothetical protein